ncbi:MAG TPA: hypothetical protein VHA52_01065 [Candidatus Babeliaceae bacterium]|nr:hypothetical protein [Candidatus Babeliaceae bacterium]
MATFLIVFAAGYYWGKKRDAQAYRDHEEKGYIENSIAYVMATRATRVINSPQTEITQSATPTNESLWYATLRSFSFKKHALEYSRQLHRRGIATTIAEKDSINTHGKKRIRYQVITTPMRRSLLMNLVDLLKNTDKLTEIDIIEAPEQSYPERSA